MAREAGVRGRGRGRGRVGGGVLEGSDESVGQGGSQAEHLEPGVGAGLGANAAAAAGVGAGGAGVGAGVNAGVAGGPRVVGAAAGVAQVPDGGLADLLRQLLERLPAVVPVQAPAMPRVAEGQPRVAVAGEAPSYIKMMEQLQKIGTGYFSGGTSTEDADAWRDRVERNFRSTRCPEEYRVDLAVHFLDGDAHLWWRSVTARRRQAEMTWADFVSEFNAKYFPQEALDRMEARFLRLSQGERTVREYDQEFNKLLVYAGHGMESDQTQARKFLMGLKPDLRARCRGLNYTTKAGLVEIAAEIESDLEGQDVADDPAVEQQEVLSDGEEPTHGQKRKWEDQGASEEEDFLDESPE